MPTTSVNVKYVNPPREGGKWWSIKTDDGVSYFRRSEIDKALQGKTCNLTFDVGKDDFKSIIKLEPAGGNGPAPEPATVAPRSVAGHKNEEDIAVLALMKSFIEAGKITDVAHCSRALIVLRDQWREYKTSEFE